MDTALTIGNLLGALGVFLFGMKIMSEALQRVAGSALKDLLARMTSNRFLGALTGVGITCIIQSSSATTVLVVSFVNAALLTLEQAIGVIMGANIGTTVTGWLVALLGFKIKITIIALPCVGLGVALSFAKKRVKLRQWGEVLLGFGLLFLGLGLLKDAVPEVDQAQLDWVQNWADKGFLSTLIFIGIGTVLTVLLQSSSATMALTLTFTAQGWIPYEAAVGMILGENIGTTATANIAAIGTSVSARRAARAHLVFNIIGVVWALALMRLLLLPLVDSLVDGDPVTAVGSGEGGAATVTAHMAMFHTAFNIINTSLLLPFVKQLAKLVTKWVPDEEPVGMLRHVTPALVETPELMVPQLRRELLEMGRIVESMHSDSIRLLTRSAWDPDAETRIVNNEQLSDDLEREINTWLAKTAHEGPGALAGELGEVALVTHRLERIGDHYANVLDLAQRNRNTGLLSPALLGEIQGVAELVGTALALLIEYLDEDEPRPEASKAAELEMQIDATHVRLRTLATQLMGQGDISSEAGIVFLDVVHHLEEVGDRAYSIVSRKRMPREPHG